MQTLISRSRSRSHGGIMNPSNAVEGHTKMHTSKKVSGNHELQTKEP
jgi:hypothetical protein